MPPLEDNKVILHGVGGKIIKAKTLNQARLVAAIDNIQAGDKKKYIGYIGLPVILWDNGLVLFSSTQFVHNVKVLGSNKYTSNSAIKLRVPAQIDV